MARPKLKIDPEQVYKLARLGCKNKEIAHFFQCSEETVCNRFSNEIQKGKADLNISLRRWQLQAAEKGNVTMLIWLGKQLLGQREPIDSIEPEFKKLSPIKKTFEQFCIDSGYPAPFEKQNEMREFVICIDDPRLLLGSRGYGKTDYAVVMGLAYQILS